MVKIALGTMHFGTLTDEATAFTLLDRFVDGGGTMLDTADCYAFWSSDGHGGHSETVIGRWLGRRPGMRDRIELSTKSGAEPGETGDWPANREGLGAPAIAAAMQGSLKRLGTEHVEVYWSHMEDRSVPLEETVGALAELVEAGTVGRVGASNHPIWRVERARGIAARDGRPGYSALQLRYSYVTPRPGVRLPDQTHRFEWPTDETIDYAVSDGLDIWAYSPLSKGSYTREDRPFAEEFDHPGTTRRLAALDEVARELGVSRNEVVLAWLVGGEPAITPIVGVSTVQQVDEALAGVRLELPAELRAKLDAAV